MVRQESVLRESKVLYIESRLSEERKEEERKEREHVVEERKTGVERNGGRKKERNTEMKGQERE